MGGIEKLKVQFGFALNVDLEYIFLVRARSLLTRLLTTMLNIINTCTHTYSNMN